MGSLLTTQSGRLDRHVRKSYLRLGPETSRHRIAFSIEEALRLCTLPGEEEGRVYCFRRVSLGGMEADANRRVWIHAMGILMDEMATQALHGSHPFAGASNAIYFNSREEALESLLRKALQELEARTANSPAWFSCALLGLPSGTCHEKQIHAIVEELQRSTNPAAGAAVFFAALGERSPIHLISAIPEEEFRAWIRNLDSGAVASDAQFVAIPNRLGAPLRRAGAECGWAAPGTVWLAVQAVHCIAPGALHSVALVSRARLLLRQLQAEQRSAENAIVHAPRRSATLRFDEETESEAGNWVLPGTPRRGGSDASGKDFSRNRTADAAGENAADTEAGQQVRTVRRDGVPDDARAHVLPEKGIGSTPLLAESTSIGGLFFLLHVLRHLGIAALLDRYPVLAEADFAGHILLRLADKAGAAEYDPIRMCLPPPDVQLPLPNELLRDAEFMRACAPAGFQLLAASITGSDALLRVWVLAVRRWCWRNGHLTLTAIVCRPGRVWLTRTDLDVTFPPALAETRIRRVGLDIDPGWVPWLGLLGKVVRFHYREGEGS
jgi:hypothetical protein